MTQETHIWIVLYGYYTIYYDYPMVRYEIIHDYTMLPYLLDIWLHVGDICDDQSPQDETCTTRFVQPAVFPAASPEDNSTPVNRSNRAGVPPPPETDQLYIYIYMYINVYKCMLCMYVYIYICVYYVCACIYSFIYHVYIMYVCMCIYIYLLAWG